MLFFDSKVLLYVRKNKLEVFLNGKHDEVEFPPKIFQNIEVLDSAGFEKLIGDFLAGFKLNKKKALLLLSGEVTFQKAIPAVDQDKVAVMTQSFLDAVPFDPQNVVLKKLPMGDQILLLATNKEIYEILLKVIGNLNWKLISVAPLSVFKEKLGQSDDVLDIGSARKVLSDNMLIKLSNFLSNGEGERDSDQAEDEETQKKGSPLTVVLIIVFALLIISGLGFEAVKLGVVKNPPPFVKSFVAGDSKKTPEKKVQPESSPSATPKPASASGSLQGLTQQRGKVKIQVLNGSNVAGQAGKVKDQLSALGYQNIETGNTENSFTYTTLDYLSKVPNGVVDELKKELEKTFTKVTSEATKSGTFDITITTGKSL